LGRAKAGIPGAICPADNGGPDGDVDSDLAARLGLF